MSPRPMRTVRVAKLEELKPAVEAHAVGDSQLDQLDLHQIIKSHVALKQLV